jgi:hypothetical protein
MTWIAGIAAAIGKFFAGLALFISFLFLFPRAGSMDSAARDMTAHIADLQQVQAILAADPALRWIEPSADMQELYEVPSLYPVTDATKARYRALAAFLQTRGFRDIAPDRRDGVLRSFRLVMVEEGYSGRQKLVEGVWLADGEPITVYEANAHCRAVLAPHWHVCQLN